MLVSIHFAQFNIQEKQIQMQQNQIKLKYLKRYAAEISRVVTLQCILSILKGSCISPHPHTYDKFAVLMR